MLLIRVLIICRPSFNASYSMFISEWLRLMLLSNLCTSKGSQSFTMSNPLILHVLWTLVVFINPVVCKYRSVSVNNVDVCRGRSKSLGKNRNIKSFDIYPMAHYPSLDLGDCLLTRPLLFYFRYHIEIISCRYRNRRGSGNFWADKSIEEAAAQL